MKVFDALAQPKRRDILRQLAAGELSAGEVASHFSVTQPAISQHLKALKEAGLVTERRDGARRLYSVRPEGMADLNNFLAEVMPAALERLKQAVEKEERSSRARHATRK